MGSQQQALRDLEGALMIPAGAALAFFAFMRLDGADYETWTEPVIAWIMARQRHTGAEPGAGLYGVALLQVGGTQVYRRPDICEDRHDERGCLIGYARGSLTEDDMPSWNEAAREHLTRCEHRRAAIAR